MSPKRGPVDEAHLITQIEGLLTNLEACHSAGLPLPAEDVRLAAILIRLYATTQEGDYDTWLDREHARHIARLFKSERLLGSVIERRKVRLKLKGPTAAKLLARSSPEPLEISLYDLLAQFQEACHKVATDRKRRPHQLRDPV